MSVIRAVQRIVVVGFVAEQTEYAPVFGARLVLMLRLLPIAVHCGTLSTRPEWVVTYKLKSEVTECRVNDGADGR